ncbi:hypothetical protein Y032_0614g684 [Ancylostoma ceylanicum]|uniref:Small ribosomal subunit protein uS12 n=1 Tax=Ancylostoma ceylanicum TaxID=53326 RepID=A0A016WKN9_9BILA|nr:hypothetical protein Y032_0614g684 [Ancylostoma ceylanicum]
MGKPKGIRTARKLKTHRQSQRWCDKAYKKAHLGTRWKSNPFGGASHAKGIVLEKIGVEAKQPNSAIRKCVRVQLIKNGKKITAFVPNDGCLNFVEVIFISLARVSNVQAHQKHWFLLAPLALPAVKLSKSNGLFWVRVTCEYRCSQ